MCCDGNHQPTPAEIAKVIGRLPPAVHAGGLLKHLVYTLPPGSPVRVHDDGSIEYTTPGIDPPPTPNGYVGLEGGNPLLFRPLWPECLARMQGTKTDPATGFIDVLMVCNQPAAPQAGKKVTCHDCIGCKVRKAPPNETTPPV